MPPRPRPEVRTRLQLLIPPIQRPTSTSTSVSSFTAVSSTHSRSPPTSAPSSPTYVESTESSESSESSASLLFFDSTEDPLHADPSATLDSLRQQSTERLAAAWEEIFQRYESTNGELDDEIDLRTGELIVDNGVLKAQQETLFGTLTSLGMELKEPLEEERKRVLERQRRREVKHQLWSSKQRSMAKSGSNEHAERISDQEPSLDEADSEEDADSESEENDPESGTEAELDEDATVFEDEFDNLFLIPNIERPPALKTVALNLVTKRGEHNQKSRKKRNGRGERLLTIMDTPALRTRNINQVQEEDRSPSLSTEAEENEVNTSDGSQEDYSADSQVDEKRDLEESRRVGKDKNLTHDKVAALNGVGRTNGVKRVGGSSTWNAATGVERQQSTQKSSDSDNESRRYYDPDFKYTGHRPAAPDTHSLISRTLGSNTSHGVSATWPATLFTHGYNGSGRCTPSPRKPKSASLQSPAPTSLATPHRTSRSTDQPVTPLFSPLRSKMNPRTAALADLLLSKKKVVPVSIKRQYSSPDMTPSPPLQPQDSTQDKPGTHLSVVPLTLSPPSAFFTTPTKKMKWGHDRAMGSLVTTPVRNRDAEQVAMGASLDGHENDSSPEYSTPRTQLANNLHRIRLHVKPETTRPPSPATDCGGQGQCDKEYCFACSL